MNFTLFNDGTCSWCKKRAVSLGYCQEHYDKVVADKWHALRIEGRTNPVPACFDEMRWMEYEVHWAETTLAKTNPCKDCTPMWKQAQVLQGRCAHPETVFVQKDGAVEGYNFDRIEEYHRACAGLLGKVIHIVSAEERLRLLEAR